MTKTTTARIQDLYNSTGKAEIQKELKIENVNAVPKLEKIVVNVGLGRHKEDKKHIEVVATTLRKITGQEPVETAAKNSIAGFKLREGQKIGYKVTLRGKIMYEFLDRLITVVLPRVRDFHGVSRKAFDPQGNYSLGIKEQSVFPELGFEDTNVLHGLQVNFTTTATSPEQGIVLLKALGMPFEKENK